MSVLGGKKTPNDSLVDDVCMYPLYFGKSQASWLADNAKHEKRI